MICEELFIPIIAMICAEARPQPCKMKATFCNRGIAKTYNKENLIIASYVFSLSKKLFYFLSLAKPYNKENFRINSNVFFFVSKVFCCRGLAKTCNKENFQIASYTFSLSQFFYHFNYSDNFMILLGPYHKFVPSFKVCRSCYNETVTTCLLPNKAIIAHICE